MKNLKLLTKATVTATVTDGCEEDNFMGFSHYIYKNELTSENMYLPMILTKKSEFHFSFLKVDSQNPKFSLEYLSGKAAVLLYKNEHNTTILQSRLFNTCWFGHDLRTLSIKNNIWV